MLFFSIPLSFRLLALVITGFSSFQGHGFAGASSFIGISLAAGIDSHRG